MSAGPDQAGSAAGIEINDAGKFQVGDRNLQFNAPVLVLQVGTDTRRVPVSGELEQIVRRLLDLGLDQKRALDETGVETGIAAPALSAPLGGGATGAWQMMQGTATATPVRTDAAGAKRLADGFSQMSAQLGSISGQLGGQVSGAVVGVQAGGRTVDLVELLVRQGSLALWRFRQASARLFGEQMAACFRATLDWPAPPEVQLLAMRASGDVEVLRGLALFLAVGPQFAQQPWVLAPLMEQLTQGRWSEALTELAARGTLDAETASLLRTQVEAIGHPFVQAEVTAAVQDAERAFREALGLDPANSAALVNLAMLLSESAVFDYVAHGRRDRDRLLSAQQCFAEARTLLANRGDPAARSELARCRLNAALMLSPDAVLESAQLPTEYVGLMRATLSRAAQQTIRWDLVQRNLARGNVDFIDQQGVAEARELFAAAGEAVQAEQCAQMLLRMAEARMNRSARMQWMQAVRPIVGSWGFRGGNMAASFSGTIVFDADGQFHRLVDVGPSMVSGPFREVSVGGYQVQGNMIRFQGMRWVAAAFPMPPGPLVAMMALQQYDAEHLYLLNPADGSQVQCWRL